MKKATGYRIVLTVISMITLGITNARAQMYSWNHLNGPDHAEVIVLKQTNNGVLYASTITGNLKSTDNGQTWTGIGNGNIGSAFDIVQTTKGTLIFGDINGNISVSTNDGMDWQKYQISFNGISAGVLSLDAKGENLVAAGTLFGVFVSADTGKTWTMTPLNQPISKVKFLDDSLLVATSGNVSLGYAGNVNTTQDGMVAVSPDSGKTWRKMSFTKMPATDIAEDANGNWYASFINGGIKMSDNQGASWSEFAMKDSSVVRMLITGSGTILASTESGLYKYNPSMNKMMRTSYSESLITTMTEAANGNILLGSNDFVRFNDKNSGIFYSKDQGSTWKMGRTNMTIYSMGADSHNRLYASDIIGGFFTSDDEGMTWSRMYDGITPSAGINAIAVKNDSIIAIAGVNGAVAVSADTGKTWNVVDDSTSSPDYGIMDFAFTSNNTILAASSNLTSNYGGVLESADMGKTWKTIGLTNDAVISVLDDKGMYFAGSLMSLFRSEDQGKTWTDLKSNFPGNVANVTLLQVSSLFETNKGDLIASTGSGIFYSTDNGDTWITSAMAQGSPVTIDQLTVLKMVEDPNGYIFAVTKNSGILVSMDEGKTWQQNTVGNKNTGSGMVGFSITIDSKGHVFAGYSNGVYEAGNLQTAIADNPIGNKPKQFTLEQNFPNPFNPTTVIPFELKEAGMVKLTIYNMVGQKVATLLSSRMSAGSHTITFDASKISSGVYFYQLRSGNNVVTRKMTLIK